MELNLQELREHVLKEAQKIDDWSLYWFLRSKNIKYLLPTNKSFRLLKYAIILHRLGLPITSSLISFINGINSRNIIQALHQLGDKHLLIFKRKPGKHYEWMLNTQLLGVFLEGENKTSVRRADDGSEKMETEGD